MPRLASSARKEAGRSCRSIPSMVARAQSSHRFTDLSSELPMRSALHGRCGFDIWG